VAAKKQPPSAPAVIERFVKALVVTAKAVVLYPPASTIPRDTAQDAAAVLREVLRERSDIRLTITKNGLYADDLPVFPDQAAYTSFALEFYNRKLAEVRFHAGVEPADLVAFLSLLKYPPDQIESSGGFESRLWDSGVSTITVKEAQVSLVDAPDAGDSASVPRLTKAQMDDLLVAAYGGRPRDQLTIARIIGDPDQVASYLVETYAGRGESDFTAAASRFEQLAEVADSAGPSERARLFGSLSDALTRLDPDLRRQLLVDEVLAQARTNDSLASVVRQMDIDEVCKMFVEGLEEEQASQEGLARAIRNLALISMADRDDVMNAAGAAMRGAGYSEGMMSQVFEMAAPSRLQVREGLGGAQEAERPAETIFKLMDLAPLPDSMADTGDDPGLRELQDEARRGITDGDVIGALVSLVGMDSRPTQFASTMSMLEDSLDILIQRGDIDVAAEVVTSLQHAVEGEALSQEQRSRVQQAVSRFARPEQVAAVSAALRLYKPGTREHESARVLLDALGPLAIEPLLEQLAKEPDMAVRKSLVDLLSGIAQEFVPELGSHITDPRWYFTRNVVSILGSTKSPAILPSLERTLRHAEPRVRRETIRALSAVNDRLAAEMLIAALADDDAQNVQLAARYLGATGARGAVSALEAVARGDGRGNRESGPRVEAIEALGRIGASESLPTLEALAGKRAIIGAAKARELRAAAESAIAAIRSRG
jgi:HEAT repeat protein